MSSCRPIVPLERRLPDVRQALASLLLVAGALVAVACRGGSPSSERLTPEKAADLIRKDAKFNQPLAVAGKTAGTRSLVDVTAVTQGVGPGLDPGEADATFTYRWVLATPELDPALLDALPPDARAELLAPAPSQAKVRLRRFDDGWHVGRYSRMYVGP